MAQELGWRDTGCRKDSRGGEEAHNVKEQLECVELSLEMGEELTELLGGQQDYREGRNRGCCGGGLLQAT